MATNCTGEGGGAPAEEPSEEELLGPDNAVDGLVWRVPDGAHGVGLVARLLGCTLKALCHVRCLPC